MNHDYKKRDYLLPKGCKDLIDVLKPKLQAAHQPWSVSKSPRPIIGEMIVTEQVTVRDLAAFVNRKPFEIIADLMELNVFVSVDKNIAFEVAAEVVRKYGYIAKKAA
jgi:Translation initiation factor IF-2, N-terminal region